MRLGWVEKGLLSKPVFITEIRRKGKRERMKRRDSIEAPVNSTNWKEEGGGGMRKGGKKYFITLLITIAISHAKVQDE